jgi:hypothetical protein
MIRIETGTGQSIISVCNYNKYQDVEDESGTASGQHRDSIGTNNKKGRREEGKNR